MSNEKALKEYTFRAFMFELLREVQLIFQSLLQHTGEIDSLRHSCIIQPCGNRERFLYRTFKVLFCILGYIY